MSSYTITTPTLPKGLELSAKIRDAFAAAAQRHGVSLDVAQAIYSDVAGVAISDFETREAETKRQVDDATGILRDRFGPDFDQKMTTARATLEQLGLGQDGLMAMEIAIGAPNAIERLVQIGEHLNGRQTSPSVETKEPAMQPTNAPRSLEAIDLDFRKLRADPEFIAQYHNPRHPLHKEAVEKMQALAKEEAAARAGKSSPPRSLDVVRAELDALQADRNFQRIHRNPLPPYHRDYPKYREAKEKRAGLLAELAAAERVRPAGVSRRAELDQLRQDPKFMAALNNRVPEGHKDHQAHVDATTKWDRLNVENSTAEAAAAVGRE
ncbi:MAG: hypothetical protein K2Y71_04550 [Xanthobacteraceae bacterium]|nr:hypothetical protein [Xanthobacteraceae bacterium]